MELNTSHFGKLNINPANIISFPVGLPGFPEQRRFVIIKRRQEMPIAWLQSVDDGNLTFAVADPGDFITAYQPRFGQGDLVGLGLKSLDEAMLLAILVLSSDPYEITANLQAPVVINPVKKLGAQLILAEEWPLKYYLFGKGEKAAGAE
ncbi:MAG: flagellar assembly protein FliW [bacterium]